VFSIGAPPFFPGAGSRGPATFRFSFSSCRFFFFFRLVFPWVPPQAFRLPCPPYVPVEVTPRRFSSWPRFFFFFGPPGPFGHLFGVCPPWLGTGGTRPPGGQFLLSAGSGQSITFRFSLPAFTLNLFAPPQTRSRLSGSTSGGL